MFHQIRFDVPARTVVEVPSIIFIHHARPPKVRYVKLQSKQTDKATAEADRRFLRACGIESDPRLVRNSKQQELSVS